MYRLSKTNDEKTGLALLLMLTRFLPLHYAERHGNERSAFTEAEATMPRYGITDIENFVEKIRFSLLLLSPRVLVERVLDAGGQLTIQDITGHGINAGTLTISGGVVDVTSQTPCFFTVEDIIVTENAIVTLEALGEEEYGMYPYGTLFVNNIPRICTGNVVVIENGVVISGLRDYGVAVDETPFTVAELFTADEVIVSSSGSFCLGVDEIDGKKVGGKAPEILKKLQDALVADFEEKTAK